MPLQLWRPETEFETLRSQMDRMMRDTERLFATFLPHFRQGMPERTGNGPRTWVPSCDLHVSNNELVVQCELPGVDPGAVEVNTTRNSIAITGEMKEEETCKDKECVIHERITGRFWRQLTLPEEINAEQAKAQFRNGMLTIRAPLAQPSQHKAHKVAIEAGK